jgi:hypothetical protein
MTVITYVCDKKALRISLSSGEEKGNIFFSHMFIP